MEQIERIMHMESLMNEVSYVIDTLDNDFKNYINALSKINELFEYYNSPQWIKDYDDGCEGNLPDDLKCGVISQDALYDLFKENDCLIAEIKEFIKQNNKK